MSLRDLNLKRTYKSLGKENILDSFLLPSLSEAIEYRRSVGFFTLQAFIDLYDGISYLVKFNKGSIKLVTSPKLTKEDYNILIKAFKEKEKVIEEAINREFNVAYDDFNNYKICEIFKLIVEGKIDIKIAITETYGMYHDKLGILIDDQYNIVTFFGSLNETDSAYNRNYEKIRLSFSWEDLNSVMDEVFEFESIWENKNENVSCIEFPEAVREKVIEFITYQTSNNPYYKKKKNFFVPRQYQVEAINCWKQNKYQGIFSMATGTGKTFTAIYGINELIKEKNEIFLILIVVPFKILVEQWERELQRFDFDVIKISSNNPNWLEKAQLKVNLLNVGRIKQYVFISTIGSFKKEKMKKLLSRVRTSIIFVADEVHNFGAFQTHKHLPEQAIYRLGLSATPKRHFDDIGTTAVLKYFDRIVFEFDLQRAITEGFLVKYDYIPIIVYLNESEQAKYDDLTTKIIKLLNIKNESEIYNVELNEIAKSLLIKRSRYVASAKSKVPTMLEEFKKLKDISDNLVYCGASFINGDDDDDVEVTTLDEDETSIQIDEAVKGLANLGFWPGKYVSSMSEEAKEFVLEQFKNKKISTLVAIKCLDEGVDIPSIKRAFILASTTNPKEFIQRRGRVLRKCVGKEKALIYDFITMPNSNTEHGTGLVIREMKRFYEFMVLSDNYEEIKACFNRILKTYSIDFTLIIQ